jgi:protein-L-isoaspartate(D-aspartate) O-methyltransferase
VLARLFQLASVEPSDHVLDVGCATGYSTAVLAWLARSVIGLEPEPELEAAARGNLGEISIANATIVTGALALGHAASAPYDVILLNGSVPAVPDTLLSQLKEGGRLAALVSASNTSNQGKAYLFVKAAQEASGVPHFDAGAKPLPGFAPKPSFVF